MKRLNMIAPFEVLRGNVSGEQKLQYATRNNSAFHAPNGRQYARNYKPRYICAVRSSDGRAYFHVKTKSATVINAASRLRMALLGASGALYAAVLKNAEVLTQAQGVYAYFKSHELTDGTFRQWLQGNLRMILANKMSAFIASASSSAGTFNLSIDNPWVKTSDVPNCPVSDNTLSMFWEQLASDPVVFTVSGAKGVAHTNDTFATVIGSHYNVLGLSADAQSEDVKIGEMYVVYPDADHNLQVESSNSVEMGTKVFLLQNTPGESQG